MDNVAVVAFIILSFSARNRLIYKCYAIVFPVTTRTFNMCAKIYQFVDSFVEGFLFYYVLLYN